MVREVENNSFGLLIILLAKNTLDNLKKCGDMGCGDFRK